VTLTPFGSGAAASGLSFRGEARQADDEQAGSATMKPIDHRCAPPVNM